MIKRIASFTAIIALCIATIPIPPAFALDSSLVITEVKIKNTSSVQADEFIELYNNGEVDLPLKNYYLEYYNVADPLSQTVTTHKGPFALPDMVLTAGTFVVLAINPAQVTDSIKLETITSLKDSEGQIRLLTPNTVEPAAFDLLDSLAWKDSLVLPTGVNAVPTLSNASLQRLTHSEDKPTVFEEGWTADIATPGTQYFVPLPPAEEPVSEPEPEPEVTPGTSNTETPDTSQEPTPPTENADVENPNPAQPNLLPITITELLPNPAPPQTDSSDEFVELYNPNEETVDLDGYQLQTGSNFTYKTTITGKSIPAKSYLILTSGETNLSLANTASNARLLAPDGSIIATIDTYEDAPEGQAWAFVAGSWQWTTTATPEAANILTVPLPKTTPAKTTSAKTSKKASPAKAKVAAAKKTSTKKSTASTKNASLANDTQAKNEVMQIPTIHPTVIAGVSVLALLYAGYEYRYDFANRLYQFRRYRSSRREARASAEG
jgi:hypothetical protein